MGKIAITSKQAAFFDVLPSSQWSPYLEKCCLLLSANSSYEHAEEDIKVLTGIPVSRGTQQRLVQRHSKELPLASEAQEKMSPPKGNDPGPSKELPLASEAQEEISPTQGKEPSPPSPFCKLPTASASEVIEEMSIDGGKVRLRTPPGFPCEWRDYKGVNLHDLGVAAFFRDNAGLVKWVNQQPLANPLVCLGDGHDGIWNLFAEIGTTPATTLASPWLCSCSQAL